VIFPVPEDVLVEPLPPDPRKIKNFIDGEKLGVRLPPQPVIKGKKEAVKRPSEELKKGLFFFGPERTLRDQNIVISLCEADRDTGFG